MFWIFLNFFINSVAFVIDMANSSINPVFKLNCKRDRFNRINRIKLSFIANLILVILIAMPNVVLLIS